MKILLKKFLKPIYHLTLGLLKRERSASEMKVRATLSDKYIRGKGVEVGALHQPLQINKDARVQYVDRMCVEDLRRHYPDLKDLDFVDVDIIDNGEELNKIPDSSLDFLVLNHMLEHCQNPLGTIRNHLRKLSPGGIIYMAIPDKRFCFDEKRGLTTFEHLVKDDTSGTGWSRHGHFLEWSTFCNKLDGEVARADAERLMEMDYSIHYHVWDFSSFSDFLEKARQYLGGSFEIEHLQQNGHEIIAILKKKTSGMEKLRGLRH